MLNTSSAVHPAILQRFQTLIQNGRLGHAYLLIGPKASGKVETAAAVAKLLNCEANADARQETGCGRCPACVKIETGQHPDVMVVDAGEEESIKIAAVREVIHRLQLRPYEGRKKVVIVRDAELMTAESGNAFLKTLEEPPPDTVLLLTTSSPELLLGTIKSRCQHVPLFPLGHGDVRKVLAGEQVDGDIAHFLEKFSNDCLGRARQLWQENFSERKNEYIDQLVLNKNNDRYLKDLLSDKDSIREALEVLLTWFRDLVFIKSGTQAEQLTNYDRRPDLEKLEATYTLEQLFDVISGIEQGLKMLDENLNIKIAFYLLMEKIWVRSSKSV